MHRRYNLLDTSRKTDFKLVINLAKFDYILEKKVEESGEIKNIQ